MLSLSYARARHHGGTSPRPSDLAGIARKLPSLDGLLKNQPLETTFDNTLGQSELSIA